MQPGQRVIAKAFGGKKIRRVVVQITENTVVICRTEEWEAARKENRAPCGVGFPIYAVKVDESGKKR